MARTRKPMALHLVEGTVNVTRHRDRLNEPEPNGRPIKPKYLDGRASEIWDEDTEIFYWLTSADSRAFAEWCKMSADLETPGSKVNRKEWRMIGQELGAFSASRSRINFKRDGKKTTKDPSEEFFGRRSS